MMSIDDTDEQKTDVVSDINEEYEPTVIHVGTMLGEFLEVAN